MQTRTNPLVPIIGATILTLGLLVIIGWWTHNLTLLRVHTGFVAMAYNTALGFALSGASLLMIRLGKSRLAAWCAALVAIIGILTLCEYGFNADLRIDELFMREYLKAGITNHVRMALCTALCFSFAGVALITQAACAVPRVRAPIVVGFGALIAGLGVVAFFGYFTGITTFYTWGKLTRMALHTAVGFQLLGIGLVALEWKTWKQFRQSLSIVAAAAGLTASLCLWQALIVVHHGQVEWIKQAAGNTSAPPGLLAMEASLPLIALLVGIGLTLLLTVAVHLTQVATERAQQAMHANREKSRFAAIVESSADIMISYGTDGQVLSCNSAAEQFIATFGDAPQAIPDGLASAFGAGSIAPALQRMTDGGGSEHSEVSAIDNAGNERILSITLSPVLEEGARLLGAALIARDITKQKQVERSIQEYAVVLEFQKAELEMANKELNALARIDSLTGLYNRRTLQERMVEEMGRAHRTGSPFSMIMLDVDYFKKYNDTYGHVAGDEILSRMGKLLDGMVRGSDFVARYGGEEFAVAVQLGAADAKAAAERIRAGVETADWPLRPITVSCGVSTYDGGAESVEALIARADGALYKSKESGRNCVTHADESDSFALRNTQGLDAPRGLKI